MRLVWEMIHGCVERHTWVDLRGEGDFHVDESADWIATIVCRGLAAETTPESRANPDAVLATRPECVVERLEDLSE